MSKPSKGTHGAHACLLTATFKLFQNNYLKAVRHLKSLDARTQETPWGRGAANPKGLMTWEQMALVHEASCPHGNWYFLPWHRHYTSYFERVLQHTLEHVLITEGVAPAQAQAQANAFSLPYWDWTAHPELPKEFTDVNSALFESTRDSRTSVRMPEVIVIPKPAGPRRVLTALHTAVTKPIVDPFFAPIATSPCRTHVLYDYYRCAKALATIEKPQSDLMYWNR